MNRELTKREKTLLLVLVVLVLVLGYCKLFLEPIDRQITSFRTNTDIEQAELDTDRVRLAQLEQMQQAIAAIKASGQERALPQYDNDQALMTELDKLMAATLQYEVDCTEGTTQEGYLVLRPVTLTYQTASYAQSRQIIDALSASANVNFLSNVDVQYDADKAQYKTVLHLILFRADTLTASPPFFRPRPFAGQRIDCVMQKKLSKQNNSGFTLSEVLIAVAILIVLMGLAMIPITRHQRDLRQTELDAKAEIVYHAAQNKLSELLANGRISDAMRRICSP